MYPIQIDESLQCCVQTHCEDSCQQVQTSIRQCDILIVVCFCIKETNALIGFEFIHALNNKKTGKEGLVALKLNMSQAYNQVEWVFVRKVMEKMEFENRDGFLPYEMRGVC